MSKMMMPSKLDRLDPVAEEVWKVLGHGFVLWVNRTTKPRGCTEGHGLLTPAIADDLP